MTHLVVLCRLLTLVLEICGCCPYLKEEKCFIGHFDCKQICFSLMELFQGMTEKDAHIVTSAMN